MFISMVVSVVCEVGRGWGNFPTAINSWFSLYKPIVETYGSKLDPVTKSLYLLLPEVIISFCP